MSLNAVFIESVEPVIVTILSGQDPSEMFILAPLCIEKRQKQTDKHCQIHFHDYFAIKSELVR